VAVGAVLLRTRSAATDGSASLKKTVAAGVGARATLSVLSSPTKAVDASASLKALGVAAAVDGAATLLAVRSAAVGCTALLVARVARPVGAAAHLVVRNALAVDGSAHLVRRVALQAQASAALKKAVRVALAADAHLKPRPTARFAVTAVALDSSLGLAAGAPTAPLSLAVRLIQLP
jgi:hypothetical protein